MHVSPMCTGMCCAVAAGHGLSSLAGPLMTDGAAEDVMDEGCASASSSGETVACLYSLRTLYLQHYTRVSK